MQGTYSKSSSLESTVQHTWEFEVSFRRLEGGRKGRRGEEREGGKGREGKEGREGEKGRGKEGRKGREEGKEEGRETFDEGSSVVIEKVLQQAVGMDTAAMHLRV